MLRPKLREDQEPKRISDNDKTKTRLVVEELIVGHDPENKCKKPPTV